MSTASLALGVDDMSLSVESLYTTNAVFKVTGYVELPDSTRLGNFKAYTTDSDNIRIESPGTDFWLEMPLSLFYSAQPAANNSFVSLKSDKISASSASHSIFCTYFVDDGVLVFQCDGMPTRSLWIECAILHTDKRV